MNKAIIGGTGVYDSGHDTIVKKVKTKYGEVELDIINIDGEDIAFLARHGKKHSVPPHLINYRANMMALKELGIEYIYTTAAVGSCNEIYTPGSVVVIDDFIDFTKSRPVTFFEGGDEPVKHVDMSDPYCKNMREQFYTAAEDMGLDIKGDALYICTEGPRFETIAEIKMYKSNGGDVVGMTSVPEVVLAKELGMCYCTIGIITNWCTGIKGEIALYDIQGVMSSNKEKVTEIFLKVFSNGLNQDNCNCNNAIIEL